MKKYLCLCFAAGSFLFMAACSGDSAKTDEKQVEFDTTLGTITKVDSADGDVTGVKTLLDNSGSATVLWVQNNNVNYSEHASGGWAAPKVLGGGDAISKLVALDNDNGNGVAAWLQKGASNYNDLWVSLDINGWQKAEMIEDVAAEIKDLSASMNSKGDVAVCWGQSNKLLFKVYSNGVGWGTLQEINNDPSSCSIAIDGDKNVTIVYTDWDGDYYNLWGAYQKASGGPGGEQILENNGGDVSEITMKVNSSGNAVVLWKQGDNIWKVLHDINNGWGSASAIGPYDKTNSLGSSGNMVIKDDKGDSLATVWVQYEKGSLDNSWTEPRPWTSSYASSTGWETPQILGSHDAWGYPQLCLNANGEGLIIWFDSTERKVWVNLKAPTTAWEAEKQIDDTQTFEGDYPVCDINNGGKKLVAWTKHDSCKQAGNCASDPTSGYYHLYVKLSGE